MKRCPFCAEDIQDAAIVCNHCHRSLVIGHQDVGVFFVPVFWRRIVGVALMLAGAVTGLLAPLAPGLLVVISIIFVWASIMLSVRAKPFVRYARRPRRCDHRGRVDILACNPIAPMSPHDFSFASPNRRSLVIGQTFQDVNDGEHIIPVPRDRQRPKFLNWCQMF
jgi:hypothetical protein